MFCAFAREEEEDLFSWCVIPSRFSFSAFLEQRGIQMCLRNSDIVCLISPADTVFKCDLMFHLYRSDSKKAGKTPMANA